MASVAKKELADLFEYRQLEYLPLDRLVRNEENPRDPPSLENVDDLCQSIELVGGILVPLVVYYDEKLDKYVILDGERRFKAAKKLGLKELPANVLPHPPDQYANLRTMFNIHLQREPWNLAAKAITLEKIIKLRPSLSNKELEAETGISERESQDLRRLLREELPRDLLLRSLKEEISPSFLIEMERSLEPCERAFPTVFKELGSHEIRYALVKKIETEVIRSPIDFRKLGSIRRLCRKSGETYGRKLFASCLRKMVARPTYSPEKAFDELKLKLQPEIDQEFGDICIEFLASLNAFARSLSNQEVPHKIRTGLKQIQKQIAKLTR